MCRARTPPSINSQNVLAGGEKRVLTSVPSLSSTWTLLPRGCTKPPDYVSTGWNLKKAPESWLGQLDWSAHLLPGLHSSFCRKPLKSPHTSSSMILCFLGTTHLHLPHLHLPRSHIWSIINSSLNPIICGSRISFFTLARQEPWKSLAEGSFGGLGASRILAPPAPSIL